MTTDSANAATVEVAAGTLRSRDGFDVGVRLDVPVRLHATPVDRAAFADAFGPAKTVAGSRRRIGDYLAEKAGPALLALPSRDAADLLADVGGIAAAAAGALRTPLFAVGLELDGPPTASAESPELAARQAERAAVAAAREAADHADDLLLRFEDIRRRNPDVPPGRLLAALDEGDRRPALLGMLGAARAEDDSHEVALWLAAGMRVHNVTDALFGDASEVDGLGPIRSLRPAPVGKLIEGCRDGVMVMRRPLRATLPGDSPLGFSDVAECDDGTVWAVHGDRGLQAWDHDAGGAGVTPAALRDRLLDAFADLAPESGVAVVPPGGPARPTAVAALAAGGAVVAVSFADDAGCGLFRATFDGPGVRLAPLRVFDDAAVVFLSPTLGLMRDGRSFRIDGGNVGFAADFGDAVTAAAAVPWLGDERLAACVKDGPVAVLGPDDGVRVDYQSEHKGFAAVAASAGRLAAVTGDRQRLVLWDLSSPQSPVADLYLLDHTRSRAADVAFA